MYAEYVKLDSTDLDILILGTVYRMRCFRNSILILNGLSD